MTYTVYAKGPKLTVLVIECDNIHELIKGIKFLIQHESSLEEITIKPNK